MNVFESSELLPDGRNAVFRRAGKLVSFSPSAIAHRINATLTYEEGSELKTVNKALNLNYLVTEIMIPTLDDLANDHYVPSLAFCPQLAAEILNKAISSENFRTYAQQSHSSAKGLAIDAWNAPPETLRMLRNRGQLGRFPCHSVDSPKTASGALVYSLVLETCKVTCQTSPNISLRLIK